MLKLALAFAAAAAFTAMAAADPPAAASPAAEPAATAAASAVATPAPIPATTATATKVDYATDPRMLAAIRHANARADQQCGGNGVTDVATQMTARTCRRHMVKAAITDAEIEIDGH